MLQRLLSLIMGMFGQQTAPEQKKPLKLDLQFFADDPDKDGGDKGAGDADGADDKGKDQDKDQDQDDDKGDDTKFSQEELDKILDKRLKRERKKWQEEIDNQKKKEQMNAEERAKAEKEEAEQKAKEAQERANAKIRQTEAKAQALELGVDPAKVKYFLKLADIDDVEIDDDGEVDVRALATSLKAVLNDMPEFKANTTSRAGQDFGGGNGGEKKAETLQDALKQYYGR